MYLNNIMKYIESEYVIINNTPCSICGGKYIAEEIAIALIDKEPYDICECVCNDCGHEKTFKFYAPFISDETFSDKFRENMN